MTPFHLTSLTFFFVFAIASAAVSKGPPRTFGIGLPAGFVPIAANPTVVMNYSLSGPSSDLGVLSHFWVTGDVDRNVLVEYFIDEESKPSIAFEPSMACGQGYPNLIENDPLPAEAGLYEAAGKMGKAGAVGGWYFKYKIPFQRSILAQIRLINSSMPSQYAYIQIRGYEVNAGDAGIVLPTGIELPRSARMQLQVIENNTWPALQLVSLANVSFGYSAILYQLTMALSTYPPANNYIEGCFHLYRTADESFPALVTGTGFEDEFNSAYWFGAASGFPNGVLFTQAESGLVHFSRGPPQGPAGLEQLSAYRFFDGEVVGMEDGGRFVWRVGDEGGKCFSNGTESIIGTPSAVAVKSYMWLYTWLNGNPIIPIGDIAQPQSISYLCAADKCVLVPNSSGDYLFSNCDEQCHPSPIPPPIPGPKDVVGCASGFCDAFCNASSTVHGCLAQWPGSVNMRAEKTGTPCGGPLGPCTTSPADACADGWDICLSNFSIIGLDIASFRAGLSYKDCASSDPRSFVSGMSHALVQWQNLPPGPCPAEVITNDNGCSLPNWGAEPVCCGSDCDIPSCPNSVWIDNTRIHVGENEACSSIQSQYVSGVLCCKMT
jgi:hypothetical protein